MRTLALPLPLLLLLAGCVALPAADDAPTARATVLPWQLTECRYLVGWSDADPALVQANLPDGFTVRSGAPLGLPLATAAAARASIGTETFECASGSGLDGTIEGMTYASIWIPVTLPEALADPEIDEVYYKIHVLVPDAPRRELMRELGLSVGNGTMAWETALVPNGLASSLTIEGAGDFVLELTAPQQTATGPGRRFIEVTPAGERGADGFAIWRTQFEWVGDSYAFGQGTIEWPEGHWVTQAIGSPRAPAQFHAGVWSFDGTVELPSR